MSLSCIISKILPHWLAQYMTACDLTKTFMFDMAIKILGYIHFPICVWTHATYMVFGYTSSVVTVPKFTLLISFLADRLYKSSALAEMGDRGHNRYRPKREGLLCPFRGGRGAWSPSNTMWPGPTSRERPIRVKWPMSDVLIFRRKNSDVQFQFWCFVVRSC